MHVSTPLNSKHGTSTAPHSSLPTLTSTLPSQHCGGDGGLVMNPKASAAGAPRSISFNQHRTRLAICTSDSLSIYRIFTQCHTCALKEENDQNSFSDIYSSNEKGNAAAVSTNSSVGNEPVRRAPTSTHGVFRHPTRIFHMADEGGFNILELYFETMLVVYVRGGETFDASERRLYVANMPRAHLGSLQNGACDEGVVADAAASLGAPAASRTFRLSDFDVKFCKIFEYKVLAVRLTRTRMIVFLENEICIYELSSMVLMNKLKRHTPSTSTYCSCYDHGITHAFWSRL